jgi:hypothetical protein
MARRSTPFLLSLLAVAVVGLSACGGDDPAAGPPADPPGGNGGTSGASGAAGASAGASAGGVAGAGAGASGAAGATAGAAGAAGTPAGGAAGASAGAGGDFGGEAGAGEGGDAGAAGEGEGGSAGSGGAGAGAGEGGASAGTGGSVAGTGGAAGTTSGSGGGGAAGAAGTGDPCGPNGCKEVDSCDDFKDQDQNGLIDCDDIPCKNTAQCVAGAKATGLACAKATDCNANGSDPACLKGKIGEGTASFDSGYCSEWCDRASNTGCLSAGRCVGIEAFFNGVADLAPVAGRGLCAKKCQLTADCPALTLCSAGVCVPHADEKCVGGVDDNNDGLIDCEDPKCATHPACTGGETNCSDFIDEDENGFTDCGDPKCKDQVVCKTTEFRVPGGPCTSSVDCSSSGNDPACLKENNAPDAVKYTAGYCSEWCDYSTGSGCSAGAVCTNAEALRAGKTSELFPPPGLPPQQGLCADGCGSTADCRAFYVCATGVCVSHHQEQCTNTLDDNNDGKIDCEDPLCAAHPACTGGEKNCSDFIDEDEDGLIDCQDDDCKSTAACAKGFSVPGAPCSSPSACTSSGGDPACIGTFTDTVYTGGYCSEWCSVLGNIGCAAGGVCVNAEQLQKGVVTQLPGRGLCLASCGASSDCRELYACQGGLCVPEPDETCGNGIDDNNNGKTDCEDSQCEKLESCKNP